MHGLAVLECFFLKIKMLLRGGKCDQVLIAFTIVFDFTGMLRTLLVP